MPSLYQQENFIGRVNYAAQCLVRRVGIGSRHFDTCFEMADGDTVVVALQRRAAKNPRLHEAILRAFSPGTNGNLYPDSWVEAAKKLVHIPTRKLREAAMAERVAWQSRHFPEKGPSP